MINPKNEKLIISDGEKKDETINPLQLPKIKEERINTLKLPETKSEKIPLNPIILPKNKKKMLIYGFLLASSGIIFGFKVTFYNSFFEEFIEQIYKITDKDKKTTIYSNLAFFFPFGCLIAAFTAFRIYEKIGRYNSFKLLSLLSFFNFGINNVVDIYFLYFGRILEGFISCFLLFVSHLMIREVVWEGVRQMVANSFIVFVMIGANLGFIFANKNNVESWRFLMFLPVLIDLAKIIIFHFYFPIKSPNYLYKKNSKTKKPKALKKLLSLNYQNFYTKKNSSTLTKNFLNSQSKNPSKKLTIKTLLKKPYKKQILFAFFINLSQQITGITTLTNFSTTIFTLQKIKHPHIITILTGLSSLLSVITITLLGKKISKKQPLLISLFFQAISWLFLIFAVFFESGFFLVFGACLFSAANSVYKSVHLSYVVEIVPSEGVGLVSVFKWGVNIVFAKFFLYWIEDFGLLFVFIGFFGVAVGCTVVFFGFAVGTEGKSQGEVFEEIRNKRFMR